MLHAPLLDVPYNLQTPKEADTSQIGQTRAVYDIFNKVRQNPSGLDSKLIFEINLIIFEACELHWVQKSGICH